MTKQELASYMVSLISIMESKEDAGRHRGQTLGKEYNLCYDQFMEIIKKEHDDETRKREQSVRRPEEGANADGDKPRLRESAR